MHATQRRTLCGIVCSSGSGSALKALTDALRLVALHTRLAALRDLVAQHAAQHGQHAAQSSASERPRGLVWALPECGEVEVSGVGLAHAELTVNSPTATPASVAGSTGDGGASGGAAGEVGVKLTVRWVSRYGGAGGGRCVFIYAGGLCFFFFILLSFYVLCFSSCLYYVLSFSSCLFYFLSFSSCLFFFLIRHVSCPCSTAPPTAAAPAAEGACEAPDDALLSHVRCSVSSVPPLPPATLAALEAQLEGGRLEALLDTLCIAAAPAAAVQQQLAPERLQAAGLGPGAAVLLPARGGPGAALPSSPSPLRLSFVAHSAGAGRAALLQCRFCPAGWTLVQAVPLGSRASMQSTGAVDAEASWMDSAWDAVQGLPGYRPVSGGEVSMSAGVEGAAGEVGAAQHARRGWVHLECLGNAVAAVLNGVGRGGKGAHR
jgi:hypothetical protein